jgi:mobilome CxxCx(11)CxxC protein
VVWFGRGTSFAGRQVKLTDDELRKEAWKKALEACGTSAIFSRRAQRIKTFSNIRDFLGIFIPVCVGTIVADISFVGSRFIEFLVAATAIPSLIQLAISVWSLVANWSEASIAWINSVISNNSLRREWEAFAKQTIPTTLENYNRLVEKTTDQEQTDLKANPSDKERRFGMRYSLREFRKECSACGEVPTTLKSSKCGVCGNF